MSTEANKATVTHFIESLNRGELTTAMGLLATDYRDTDAPAGTAPGAEGWLQNHRVFFEAFPDLRLTIAEQIAEGDRVVTRWTATGTHTGTFPGLPTTGRQVTFIGVSVGRIADGQFKENLDVIDQFGIMQQLGAIPAPGQAA